MNAKITRPHIYAVLSGGGVADAVDVARAAIARETGLDADYLSCKASSKSDWKTSLFPNFFGVKYWHVLCDMQIGNKLIGGSVIASPVGLGDEVYGETYDLSRPHLPSQNISFREFPAKISKTNITVQRLLGQRGIVISRASCFCRHKNTSPQPKYRE